jgi:hypothetical protein
MHPSDTVGDVFVFFEGEQVWLDVLEIVSHDRACLL